MDVIIYSIGSNFRGYYHYYNSGFSRGLLIQLEKSLEESKLRLIVSSGRRALFSSVEIDVSEKSVEVYSIGRPPPGYSILLPNYNIVIISNQNQNRNRMCETMVWNGIFDLGQGTFEGSPMVGDMVEGHILMAKSIPSSSEVVVITRGSSKKNEDTEERGKGEKKNSEPSEEGKPDCKRDLKSYMCVYDYERRKLLHRIQLKCDFPPFTTYNSIQLYVENDYVFVIVQGTLLVYDTKNMYQLTREFRNLSCSLLIPIPYHLFSARNTHHSTFSQGRKCRKGMILPTTFYSRGGVSSSIIQVDPLTGSSSTHPTQVLESIQEHVIKKTVFLKERNLGFFITQKEDSSTEETYLSVYDFVSQEVIRSFTRPILPKSEYNGNVKFSVDFVDFQVEDLEESEVLLSVLIQGELRVFGYKGKEEIESYRDQMNYLIDTFSSSSSSSDDDDDNDSNQRKGIEFVKYMLCRNKKDLEVSEMTIKKHYLETQIEEKLSLFIRLLLGRHVWKHLDPETFLKFYEFFDLCGLEKMKIMLTLEFYTYLRAWLVSHPKTIRSVEMKKRKEKEKEELYKFEEDVDYVVQDFERKKKKVRELIHALKVCLRKYEIDDDDDDNNNIHEKTITSDVLKPPFKQPVTLCLYNLLKSFHEYVSVYDLKVGYFSVLFSDDLGIWKSFDYYKVISRLETHPTLQNNSPIQNQNEEEEEVEGEEEEDDDATKKKSQISTSFTPFVSSTLYECYRNQLKFLYETKIGANITIECTSEEEGDSEKNERKVFTIQCHKEILIFRSRFIKMMLSFPGVESLEESASGKLRIELLDYEQMKLYIEFLYLGCIRDIDFGGLMKLINHSEMFQESELSAYCAEKIRVLSQKLDKIELEDDGEDDDNQQKQKEKDDDDGDEYYDDFLEYEDIRKTELTKQLKMTGCYLENEKIVWNVMVSCFWEFLSKDEIVVLINDSRVEHGLEKLDFTCFLMFPDM